MGRLESAATAAVLVAVLAVPTASDNVKFPDKRMSDTPLVSEESQMRIDMNVDADRKSTARIQKHNMVYKVSELPSKRIEVLRTPQGTLKILRTNKSRIFKLDTPYGDLKKGMRDGRRVSSFKGLNRTQTEKLLQNLRTRAQVHRDRVKKEMMPDLDIKITKSKADDEDERILIDNDEDRSINLESWTLVNSDGDRYNFENLELPAYGEAYVYNAPEDELNVTEDNSTKYVYATGIDWDQDSEDASLFNIRGLEVASDSY